jgi:uncharacterized protein YfeS
MLIYQNPSKMNFLLFSIFLLISSLACRNQVYTERFEFSPNTADSNARALMKEDFFWSPIDESGPFGSDAGSDAAHGFRRWKITHTAISPIVYLEDLMSSWNYPEIAWDEMDPAKLGKYMKTPYVLSQSEIDQQVNLLKQENDISQVNPGAKNLSDEQIHQMVTSSGLNMGIIYLIDLDEAIIGTAFAQFVLEGRIDPQLKYYATKALEREMLTILTSQFGRPDQLKEHQEKMAKLLQVVQKMPC